MTQINKKLLNELEYRFIDYPNIQENILKEKTYSELLTDEKLKEFPQLSKDVSLGQEYIEEQERDERAAIETLASLTDAERELIIRKYWGDCSWMTWKEFGREVNRSPASMSRLKQKVLITFGKKINRVGKW